MEGLHGIREAILGIDIGSAAIKAVLLAPQGVMGSTYRRLDKAAVLAFREIIAWCAESFSEQPEYFALTGRGAEGLAEAHGWPLVNEIFAQASGALMLLPEARSVIDIGGNDAAYISLSDNASPASPALAGFATNSRCAAGTGSFLEQQAARLGLAIGGGDAGVCADVAACGDVAACAGVMSGAEARTGVGNYKGELYTQQDSRRHYSKNYKDEYVEQASMLQLEDVTPPCVKNYKGEYVEQPSSLKRECASSPSAINYKGDFSKLALSAKHVPHIAGRCSVFAKSDMIHLQQIATPDNEIVAGLCQAMAESFKGDIMKGSAPLLPISFQGGVAKNAAMVAFMRRAFSLREDELIVHPAPHLAGAMGAALRASLEGKRIKMEEAIRALGCDAPSVRRNSGTRLAPLSPPLSAYLAPPPSGASEFGHSGANRVADGDVRDVFLGIDIGSVSTNLALIDRAGALVAKRYLPTAGRPIEAVLTGLREIHAECGASLRVLGCGATGSGRYLIADLFGADIVKNEITAQARGAISLCPDVDTIFEIGGQDSKYIAIDNGIVTDFTMNKACAAGTGSFIEEQANLMGISVRDDFAMRAFAASEPAALGQRCTVFIENDVLRRLAEGDSIENLSAGIAYSIVYNYLHRVVENRRIGQKVLFQGGTASNQAVTAAFREVTGREVLVPPHNDVTGAIGMAVIASESWREKPFATSFIGLDCGSLEYSVRTFVCNACANKCQIREVRRAGSEPFYYGHRCERYERAKNKAADAEELDFTRFRKKLLTETLGRIAAARMPETQAPGKRGDAPKRIGIPLALSFYETLPFWAAFWTSLGYAVIHSGETTPAIAEKGILRSTAETCYPIKVFLGHAEELLNKGVDSIFMPSVINMPLEGSKSEHNFTCTLVQSAPFLLRAAFRDCTFNLLSPVLHMQYGRRRILRELAPLARELGLPMRRLARAYNEAYRVQALWRESLEGAALAFLERYKSRPIAVIASRPYNGCDSGLNIAVPRRLAESGVPVMTLEALPLSVFDDGAGEGHAWENMYWRYGQRIMRGLDWTARAPALLPIYITNFSCGPDSFLLHYAQETMKSRPLLVLELDEHSADAGVVTRLEAYLDSALPRTQELEADTCAATGTRRAASTQSKQRNEKTLHGKRVYVPYMSEISMPIAAAFRRAGIDASVLPVPDRHNIELGRRLTSGRECYPLVLTAGDIFRIPEMPDYEAGRAVFFMPTTNGPCRFGEYARLHSLLLERQELSGIEIFSPNSGTGYEELRELSMGFYLDIWNGMVCVDTLSKALHALRPYEEAPGMSDALYKECIARLERELESGKRDLPDLMRDFQKRFQTIPRRAADGVPIGMVGEIYVRMNSFANGDIIRRLEHLGAEVVFAPFTEWSFYVNHLSMRNNLDQGRPLAALSDFLRNKIQYALESRLEAPFHKHALFKEPEINAVLEAAEGFIDRRIRGEAVLTVGKAVDFAARGFGGIVNVLPFSCMPGLIVSSLAPAITRRLGDLPWLNLSFEDSVADVDAMRLEAFVEQARSYHARMREKTHARR